MSLSAHDPSGRADPLVGVELAGRYQIERVIEKGGAGIIYYAQHAGLEKPAAVKVLSAAWSTDDTAVERFQREARAASQVGHRNIVDVYDMGVLDDGRPWLVMQWLDGQELGDLLEQEGVLDPWTAANIVYQAASALDAVHAKGIIHRDIKPENFFLHTEEDGTQVLKLLDFGLAAMQRPGDQAKRLTRQGVIHGTPHYMAPEATGNDLPDHRADVYSLAVVAFEMLTGELPFDSDNPMQILTLKLSMDPPTMQERTQHPFPEELERIIAWGLARDPASRAQSAGQFAEAFADVVRTTDWSATPKISGVHPKPNVTPSGTALGAIPSISDSIPPGHPGSIPPGHPGSIPPGHPGSIPPGHPGSIPPQRASIPPGAGGSRDVPTLTLVRPSPWRRWLSLAVLLLGLVAIGVVLGKIVIEEPEPIATPLPADELVAEPELEAAPEPTPDEPIVETAPVIEPEMVFTEEEAVDDVEAPTMERSSMRRRRGRPSRMAAASETEPSLASSDRERSQELTREATAALFQSRFSDAVQLFRDATIAHPGNARAWRGLGLANERLGRGPEAVRAYQRYLRVAPSASDADEVRSRIARLSGG
jgi:serine/threonine-protein kinase